MKAAELAALDEAILAAHERDDTQALYKLYAKTARHKATLGAADAAYFFLTQAFVFALDSGDPEAETIASELRRAGRL